jgi:hypothetical protein
MVRGQLWTVGRSIKDSREPIGDHFDEANAGQTPSQKTEHDRSGKKANRATHRAVFDIPPQSQLHPIFICPVLASDKPLSS